LEAAVVHAVDYFKITDPYRQRRVAVRPIEEAAN
jgi:hypothetical protein